ncbi:MAG: TIGR03750 family conjugal transfer protein [Tatlockia sp.]|nr:TIGR03750 family conjugal transfer protein [Tatlockia sp.]
MPAPSSRHLSHDFPAFRGLSLRELSLLVLVTTTSITLLFIVAGLLTGFTVAFGCLGLLTGFIVSVALMPKPIARLKAGKPYGHLMKITTLRLASWGLIKNPYLTYSGRWHKTRRRTHV